jgi:hypothetical protein
MADLTGTADLTATTDATATGSKEGIAVVALSLSGTTAVVVGGAGHQSAPALALGTDLTLAYQRRGRPYVNGVWHRMAVAAAPATPVIVMIPPGVKDFTLYAIGEAANSCKVSKSIDSAATIWGGTPTWLTVDASLNSVGTALVRYALGNKLPVALKVESLVSAKWAKMVLLGKWLP